MSLSESEIDYSDSDDECTLNALTHNVINIAKPEPNNSPTDINACSSRTQQKDEPKIFKGKATSLLSQKRRTIPVTIKIGNE